MSDTCRLMQAPNEEIDLAQVRWPMFGSYKMDGYRVCAHNGFLRSKTWKLESTPLHLRMRNVLKAAKEAGVVLDGELWSPKFDFSELASAASAPTQDKLDLSIKYYMFDLVPMNSWGDGYGLAFKTRELMYNQFADAVGSEWLVPVPQVLVQSVAQAKEMMELALENGFEGLMLRCPMSVYKHGRATLNEHSIFKMKKWVTLDAQIIGFEQATRMKAEVKDGARTRDDRGYLERTSCKATRELAESIGAFKVRTADGNQFKVTIAKEGAAVRKLINWGNREKFIGKWVEFKYQEHGTKYKPRFGRITRMRPDMD